MGLWSSIGRGFTSRVGSELAKKGMDELLEEKPDPEAEARALAVRKRKVALGVVIASAVGLLVLSGALTKIFVWLLGMAFVAGLLGGGWFLLRNRWYAMRAARDERRTKEVEAKATSDNEQRVAAQLAELKRQRAKPGDR